MSAPKLLACPKCAVKLNLAVVPPAGKKIRCPKCQTVVRVPGTAATPDESPYVDDDPYVDEDPYVDVPRSSRRRGRRKRGTRSINLKKPLKILAVLVLLGSVGLGLSLLVKKQFGGLSGLSEELGITGGIDYTYLPAGTQSITFLRPRARWNAEISKQFRDAAWSDAALARFEELYGYAYTDIISATYFDFGRGGLEVMELATAVDPQTIVLRHPGLQEVRRGTRTYYVLARESGRNALYFPTPTTKIEATEDVVTSIIDGTFVAGNAAAFNFVDDGGHHVEATLQVDRTSLWASLNDNPIFGMVGFGSSAFESVHGGEIVSFADSDRFRSDVQFRHSFKFSSDEAAEQARAWLAERVAKNLEPAQKKVQQVEQRLEAARNAERERVERADRGDNPFQNQHGPRVAAVEEELRTAQADAAVLRGSEISRSGSLLSVVTSVPADYFAARVPLQHSIVSDNFLSGQIARDPTPLVISRPNNASAASAMPPGTTSSSTSAATTSAPTGNQRRVVELTHDIRDYNSDNLSDLNQKVEQALLKVNGYVTGSAVIDVAQGQITFQLLAEEQDRRAVLKLRDMGLTVDFRAARQQVLWREVAGIPDYMILLEFEILATRPGPADRSQVVEEVLAGMDGYVRGSLDIDEPAKRVRLRFTRQPDVNAVIFTLNGPGGLSVRQPGQGPTLPREIAEQIAAAKNQNRFVSVYYASYAATGPVADAAQGLAEGTPGFVAGTLNFEEASRYFTFQVQGGPADAREIHARLTAAGFRDFRFTTMGTKPSTVETLRNGGSNRKSGEDQK
jgi:hypothetical protein